MTDLQGMLRSYAAAGALILAAVLVRLVLQTTLGFSGSGLLFTPAILVGAMMGGLAPGLAATVASLPFLYFLSIGATHPAEAAINPPRSSPG